MTVQQFGERIRIARERKGLSQEQLGGIIGKDQKAISEYENGQRRLTAVDVPLLANALNVPILYFYVDDITSLDLDAVLLTEFHRLKRQQDQETAIEMLRLFSNSIEQYTA